ncbi:MAG: M1 family metallopeptidase, partial [Bacteroidia bacterium]|nr:M1 family metallopeptidase [Bacteroidia bacterium]
MKKLQFVFIGLSLLIYSPYLMGQSKLHIPKEIQEAYKTETRSMDGNPGKNYWQNQVDYSIEVDVTPETRGIDGRETVTFKNNSPDDLNEVVIRLYYDVFKKGNQRDMPVNVEDIGDGVNLKSIKVAGQSYDPTNPDQVRRGGTNMSLLLSEPLKSGDQLKMEFEWEQKVPLTVRRTGAIDSTSFFVAYWYPQVAVYDDVFGWDRIDYTFGTEFYNNLGNFDVKISAPDNFLVWSTGTLQNSDDILPEPILKKYKQAQTSSDLVNIVNGEDITDLKLKSGTWHYKANEVIDFAFAISDHYLWDGLSQKVDGRDVFISTAFPRATAGRYGQVTKIQQKTMKHFSEDIPGVAYPYPAFTTFIGLRGGGMEFPMMANNAGPGQGVTIHELFHTYFPMYVRINERRFAWMDEGWANFITSLVTYKYFNDNPNKGSFYSSLKSGVQGMSGSIGDLPTVTSSQYMSGNYGYQSYSLPSFTYGMLYQYLGEEKFLECYQAYIRRWAKKSPTPYDFFYTFENVSGEDLSWFWNSWYFELGYPDLSLFAFKDGKLLVKKVGKRPVPLSLSMEYTDGEGIRNDYMILKPTIWNNNDNYSVTIPDAANLKSLTINADFPDFNELDNYYPPLADRYKSFDLSGDVLGVYPVQQFPVEIEISEVDGVYQMVIANAGMSGYLIPIDNLNFKSTDGNISLKFSEENGKVKGVEMKIASFGIT